MYEASPTPVINTGGFNSQLSFYEYPPHKPYTNSTYQPLRPSHNLSTSVTLPESNRDQLLTSLQSLSLKIKTLEKQREKAEISFHEITNSCPPRSPTRHREPKTTIDEQLKEAEENFRRLQSQHKRVTQVLNEHRSQPKIRTNRKKKRSSHHNQSLDTATTLINTEGRHHHLDLNNVPFILGQSTAPSHNVKSNVQNVRSKTRKKNLLRHYLEYSDLLHPRHKTEISPHTLLYLDHYNKPSNRPSSASPVRTTTRRPITTSSTRRPQTASTTDNQCYSRIKRLRREYVVLSREHARLNSSYASADDIEFIGRRMDIILEELGQLQRQYMMTSQDHMEQDLNETPIETLRRTKLLQLILKDSINKQQKTLNLFYCIT